MILIDSSFLVALLNSKDKNHVSAKTLSQYEHGQNIILQPVITEVFYMVSIRQGYDTAIRFLEAIPKTPYKILAIEEVDIQRIIKIMQQYRSAEFDFVDTCIMAVAERLDIRTICTFDKRDFSIFRPQHCPNFEILP